MQFKRYIVPPAVALGLMLTACNGSEPVTNTIDGVPATTAEPVVAGYTELEMATLLEAGDWGNDFAPAVVDNVICSQQSSDKFICDGDYINGETTPAKWEVTVTDNGQWLASPVVE